MADTRRSVIITFKPKDQRPDKSKDKLEVVDSVISSKVRFFSGDEMSRGVAVPSGMPEEMIGYDINDFDAPLVMAYLTDKEIDDLDNNDNVEAVEDDGPCYALDGFDDTEGILIEDQPTVQAEICPAGVAQIKAPRAWDCSRGKAVKVFVLDTGIDFKHQDLSSNYKTGTSFVPTESSPMDFQSHGTHCAGTIAAAVNGRGVIGVAPKAYLYAVKVLNKNGSGQWSQLIAGLDWVGKKKGLRVASMSLGGSSAPSALEKACNSAYKKGVLLVAAAGNSGAGPPVLVPARYKNVIAVSAIDSSNVIAGFSSRGKEVELCAPGVNVLSTVPGNRYGRKSGTSMACPHVSGAAALTWGSHRLANNATIRKILVEQADNLGVPGRDREYGYGRVDAENSACFIPLPNWKPAPAP